MPLSTATRFVLLTHPREARREKAGTGRLTHLSLPNSEIVVGAAFEDHPRVDALLADERSHVVLLYPGVEAVNLSAVVAPPPSGLFPVDRQLVVLLLDATWSCARKMLKLSPRLQRLPRIMFTPAAPSRFIIKQQPMEGCLSTLESVHEVLVALDRLGLEDYARPAQLLELFAQMQRFQIDCALDPARGGYRRQPYQEPGERQPMRGSSRRRRENYFRVGQAAPAPGAPAADSGG